MGDITADTVQTFLDKLADKFALSMGHKLERHMPHFTKAQVYNAYVQEFSRLHPNNTPASSSYFLSIWKMQHSFIIVVKVPSFTKCSEFELLRVALREASWNGSDTGNHIEQRDAHVQFIELELRYYCKKAEVAK